MGYHSITLYPGYNMISVNFANITNKTGYTLDEIFPGKTPGLVAYRDSDSADYVQIWDAANGRYKGDSYYLYLSRRGDQPDIDYTWRLDADNPSPILVKSGDSMWYYHRGAESVTVQVSGEVEFNVTTKPTIHIYPGYNMIAAPYAAGLNFKANNAEYWKTCGAVAYRDSDSADYVQIWDAANGRYKGDSYYLYLSRRGDQPDIDYTWRLDADNPAPTEITTMGQGLWYYHKGKGFDLELTYPYDLSNK